MQGGNNAVIDAALARSTRYGAPGRGITLNVSCQRNARPKRALTILKPRRAEWLGKKKKKRTLKRQPREKKLKILGRKEEKNASSSKKGSKKSLSPSVSSSSSSYNVNRYIYIYFRIFNNNDSSYYNCNGYERRGKEKMLKGRFQRRGNRLDGAQDRIARSEGTSGRVPLFRLKQARQPRHDGYTCTIVGRIRGHPPQTRLHAAHGREGEDRVDLGQRERERERYEIKGDKPGRCWFAREIQRARVLSSLLLRHPPPPPPPCTCLDGQYDGQVSVSPFLLTSKPSFWKPPFCSCISRVIFF